MTQPPALFNEAAYQRQMQRLRENEIMPILHEIYTRTVDCLCDFNRKFAEVTHLGISDAALQYTLAENGYKTQINNIPQTALLQGKLPLSEASCDAILCIMALQHINDIPGALIQLRRALKPDGLLLIILPGAHSLHELRQALALTESQLYGGITPRVSPFPELRDGGGLLQRAGLALPVASSETLTITYPDIFALLRDLRSGGQNNCMQARQKYFTPLNFFSKTADNYAQNHTYANGQITATLELLILTGFAPAPNQQQPSKRGSGTQKLFF